MTSLYIALTSVFLFASALDLLDKCLNFTQSDSILATVCVLIYVTISTDRRELGQYTWPTAMLLHIYCHICSCAYTLRNKARWSREDISYNIYIITICSVLNLCIGYYSTDG